RHTRSDRDWSSDVCSSDLPSSLFLLPRHRDLYPLFRTDEVIVVVFAEIDLHPVNLAAEDAAVAVVIGSNRRAGFAADVGGLVGRSEERRVGKECGARGGTA